MAVLAHGLVVIQSNPVDSNIETSEDVENDWCY